MKVDFERKQIICDCGEVSDMDSMAICHCPICETFSFQCTVVACGYHVIPPIVYRYIDTYQEE